MKLFYGGKIITLTNRAASAVLIHKDCIVGVGSSDELLGAESGHIQKVNLMGKTLIPGFIDSHSHFSEFAKTLNTIPLGGCTSFSQIQEKIKNHLDKNPIKSNEWIIAFGYDQNSLQEQAHPTKDILDEISKKNPIVITHSSGHMGVVNSVALELLGINENTADPIGGKIGRTTGELNGYLEEAAFTDLIKSGIPKNYDELLDRAQETYFKYGITTAQDGMIKADGLSSIIEYSKKGKLNIDLIGYGDIRAHEKFLVSNEYKKHFRIDGFKTFLDGSPQGRTAWMREPYVNDGDYRGYPILDDEQVLKNLILANEKSAPLIAHCNGDAAIDQYIGAIKKVGNAIRPTAIHCQFATKEQLSLMAKLNITASFFMAHTYYFGDAHIKNLGMERARNISPAKSAIDEGVNVTLHQDTPVIEPDMAKTIKCAMKRTTASGVRLNQKECISFLEALETVCKNPAIQYGEQNEKGTIEVGKKADFVIFDEKTFSVYETIKDGSTVYLNV